MGNSIKQLNIEKVHVQTVVQKHMTLKIALLVHAKQVQSSPIKIFSQMN